MLPLRSNSLCPGAGAVSAGGRDAAALLGPAGAVAILYRGEFQTAREFGEQLLPGSSAQDPALLLEAHRALGPPCSILGSLPPARGELEHGMALYNPQQHHSLAFLYGQDPGVICRCYEPLTFWLLGYPDQACSRVTRQSPWPRSWRILIAWLLPWTDLPGSTSSAGNGRQCRSGQSHHGSLDRSRVCTLVGVGTIRRGWALAERGQGTRGLRRYRGHSCLAGYGVRLQWASHIIWPSWPRYTGKAGRPEGLNVLAEALAEIDTTGERLLGSGTVRLKGELLLRATYTKSPRRQPAFTTPSILPAASRRSRWNCGRR